MSQGLAPLQVSGAATRRQAGGLPRGGGVRAGGRSRSARGAPQPAPSDGAAGRCPHAPSGEGSAAPTGPSERRGRARRGPRVLIPLPRPVPWAKRLRSRAPPLRVGDRGCSCVPKDSCPCQERAVVPFLLQLIPSPPFRPFFVSTPTPSLRELAGHPLAVHLVPLCAFPLPLPDGGSGGGRAGMWTSAACMPLAGGALRKALAGDLLGSWGWECCDRPHFVDCGPRLSCFAFHLSSSKGTPLSRGMGLGGDESEKQCVSVLRMEVGGP